jgi:ankyrin repeat protein
LKLFFEEFADQLRCCPGKLILPWIVDDKMRSLGAKICMRRHQSLLESHDGMGTCLLIAAASISPATITFLLDADSKVTAVNCFGQSPLHIVYEHPRILHKRARLLENKHLVLDRVLACLQILVKNGANVNQADHQGKTPIFYAAKANHIDGYKYLIRHGAQALHRDLAGNCFYQNNDIPQSFYSDLIETGFRFSVDCFISYSNIRSEIIHRYHGNYEQKGLRIDIEPTTGDTVLHLVLNSDYWRPSIRLQLLGDLLSLETELVHKVNHNGFTPLMNSLVTPGFRDWRLLLMLLVKVPSLARIPYITPQNRMRNLYYRRLNRQIPLHWIVQRQERDEYYWKCVKVLLREYPEGLTAVDQVRITPVTYIVAADDELARIVLRVNPSTNLTRFHNINWKARRFAFLLVSGKAINRNIFKELSYSRSDIFRYVVLFL